MKTPNRIYYFNKMTTFCAVYPDFSSLKQWKSSYRDNLIALDAEIRSMNTHRYMKCHYYTAVI